MHVTPANLSIFFTALETRFSTAYGATPSVYDKICTTYPVSTETWVSGWIGMLDKFREWIGPRVTRQPNPQTYMVQIQNFEKTESIDEFKLADDTYGIYDPIVTNFAEQAKKWPDYQVRDLLQSQGSQGGTRQLSLDGLTHWNIAHPVSFWDSSKGTYPNDYTNGGQTVNGKLIGGALHPNSFANVFQDMARRKTESGEPWGIVPNLAMTGVMLKASIDTILQAQFMGLPQVGVIGGGNFPTAGSPTPINSTLVGATDNVLKGWTDRLMWPELGGAATVGGGTQDDLWYMLDTSRAIRPFSWLLRLAPDFVIRNQPNDPQVFDTHTISYGSKARGAPAWGFPQMASRSGP